MKAEGGRRKAEGGTGGTPGAGCRRVAALLPGLMDSDLAPEKRLAVEEHLAGCPACRAEAAALRRLSEALCQDPLPDAPLPSGHAVAAWVAEQEAARNRSPWWVRPRLVLAPGLAAVLVLAAGLLLRPHPHRKAVHSEAPSLPALVVLDDEHTGRRVFLVPAP